LLASALAGPAAAHHGKDFLLLETDDMPAQGHAYGLLSSDDSIEKDGGRSTEVTPGFLFGLGDKWSVEPHFHVARSSDRDWRYSASAIGVKYRIGNLPRSEWRSAVSFEVEKPRREHVSVEERAGEALRTGPRHGDGEHEEGGSLPSEGTLRVVLARTYPKALVAANLLAGRQFVHGGGERSWAIGLGVLTPLPNGDRVGLEAMANLPLRDGVELMPGYYLSRGDMSVKLGLGLYTSRATTTGALHTAFIQRF
jgi:hypothetical protein